MNRLKLLFSVLIFTFSFSIQSNSQSVPASFADLAEKLSPSVVNISTTTIIEQKYSGYEKGQKDKKELMT